MGSEWPTVELRNVLGGKGYIRGPFGSALKRAELLDVGIPVYEQQHAIYDSREFRFYIDEEKYASLARFTVKPDDLIISCSGTVGRISIIKEEDPKGIISQALLILRPDTSCIDPQFFYYILSSPAGYHSLVSVSTGSVQVNIAKRAIIETVEIPFPPLPEQKAIAHILGTLDDKIELNRRMNATLEGMAQALFKSWFVDFDPVIDNALAAGNPIPDELAPRAEVRKNALANGTTQQGSVDHPTLSDPKSLFPAVFQYTEELGWIPEGWEVQKLGDFALNITDGTHSTVKDNPEGECYLLSCKNIKNGQITIGSSERKINLETLNKLKKRTNLSKCDILLTTVGTVGETAMIRSEEIPYDFQRSVGIIKPNLEKSASEYLYQMVKSERFLHEALVRSEGSVQRCLFLGAIKSIEVIVPDLGALERFEELAREMYDRVETNVRTNESLTKLRDTLLPKLISGELRTSEAEQLTDEALA